MILVDNGDAFEGSPVSDMIAAPGAGSTAHPMVAAMNALRYDAATPGNHDFTYGVDFLRNLSREARFPFVSANITVRNDDVPADARTLFPAWTIIAKTVVDDAGRQHTIRVGLIGLAPPQTVDWERCALGHTLESSAIVSTARRVVPEIRQAGADIVVALAHSGIATTDTFDSSENAVAPLAAIDGIDAIVAGHVHKVFPGPGWCGLEAGDPGAGTIRDTPVVMAGAYGSHIGLIDLDLAAAGDGRWHIVRSESRADPVGPAGAEDTVFAHPPLAGVLRKTHDVTLRQLRRQVGRTSRPIHSHFCMVAPCPALSVTGRALIWHARRTPALSGAGLPLVAAVSAFRVSGSGGADGYCDIPPGPLLMRHAAALYPFANTICALELSIGQVRRWLDRSAQVFAPIRSGVRDQPLLDPAVPAYKFDVFAGLTYEIDPSRPARRVGKLRLEDGTVPAETDRVTVLTNSFRAIGGGGFDEAREAGSRRHDTTSLQDILCAYFATGDFDASAQNVWRFAPIPDTSAWFTSGIGSPAHLGDTMQGAIRHDGPAEDGFERFIIDF